MQRKLTEGPLLDERGNLAEAGYSTTLVKTYNRKAVKVKGLRIKEWDYYYAGDGKKGLALTIADNSYMSLVSASVLDFEAPSYITKSEIKFFSLGKLKLPASSGEGNLCYESKRIKMQFLNSGATRRLVAEFGKFEGKRALYADISLIGGGESMVIATPFKKKGHFYYNQKINCMEVSGSFSVGEREYRFEDASAVLDWGRGVWTYRNTWYWASLSCKASGRRFGLNLGYGFGDASAATENMVFLDGKAYKLGTVDFGIPIGTGGKEDFMQDWHITSDGGELDIIFSPIIDRADCTSALIIKSDQHQVFGRFFGKVKAGEEILTLTGQTGFAEKVYNKW